MKHAAKSKRLPFARICVFAFVVLPALASTLCVADSVATIHERLGGTLSLKDGQLSIGAKPVPWDSASYIICSDAPATLTSSRVVRLKNGEVWPAEISGLAAKKLTIDAPAFGTRRVDIALVAGIDFVQNLEWDAGARSATLYRDKAQPIPGDILWIDREKLALNTALGALTLQRDSLTRYVFSTQLQETTEGLDEIALRDGSIFKGKASLGGTNFELTHNTLGKLSFPLSALRYILRNSTSAANIRGFSAEQVQFTPLINTRMPPEGVHDLKGGIWGIRIWPRTVAKYPLPVNQEKIVFRAGLSCTPAAAGHARVRISAGGKTLFEKSVSENSEWINVVLPKAKELEIEVDFADGPNFPADVVLREPQLVCE